MIAKIVQKFVDVFDGASKKPAGACPEIAKVSSQTVAPTGQAESVRPKQVSKKSLQETKLPTVEHTPLVREPVAVIKMAGAFNRKLTDDERASLLAKAEQDQNAAPTESRIALMKYCDRELEKFKYTYKQEGESRD